VRRQVQKFDWQVLPNFENYIKIFKNGEPKDTFYDFDYKYLGDLCLKTKTIMPNSGGVIKV